MRDAIIKRRSEHAEYKALQSDASTSEITSVTNEKARLSTSHQLQNVLCQF